MKDYSYQGKQSGHDYAMLLELPEQRKEVVEAMVARSRPELYAMFKKHGVDFLGQEFLAGIKYGGSQLLN